MEPITSDVPATHRNVPHDLLARLYREIGVSAVATALGLAEPAPQPSTTIKKEDPTRRAA